MAGDGAWPFRYLAIAGGAERGLAYCGALHALRDIAGEPLHRAFEGFAGTSIGAAIALLVAIGFEPAEIVAAWLVEPPTWPLDMRGFLEADVCDYGPPTGRARSRRACRIPSSDRRPPCWNAFR